MKQDKGMETAMEKKQSGEDRAGGVSDNEVNEENIDNGDGSEGAWPEERGRQWEAWRAKRRAERRSLSSKGGWNHVRRATSVRELRGVNQRQGNAANISEGG